MRLASPKGEFALPDPPPAKILFVTAGSGITPVMAMLRTLNSRGQSADIVHIHSAPSADDVIFHDELRELEESQAGYRLHLQLTETQGHLDFDETRRRRGRLAGPPRLGVRSDRHAGHRRRGLEGRGV